MKKVIYLLVLCMVLEWLDVERIKKIKNLCLEMCP